MCKNKRVCCRYGGTLSSLVLGHQPAKATGVALSTRGRWASLNSAAVVHHVPISPRAHCAHRRYGLNRLYPGTPGARVYNWVRGSKVTPGCGTARKYVAIFSQTSQGRWPYLLTLPSVCLHLYNPPICTKTAGTMGNALNRVVMSVGLPAPSTVAAITLLHARFTCWATQMSWWIDFFLWNYSG